MPIPILIKRLTLRHEGRRTAAGASPSGSATRTRSPVSRSARRPHRPAPSPEVTEATMTHSRTFSSPPCSRGAAAPPERDWRRCRPSRTLRRGGKRRLRRRGVTVPMGTCAGGKTLEAKAFRQKLLRPHCCIRCATKSNSSKSCDQLLAQWLGARPSLRCSCQPMPSVQRYRAARRHQGGAAGFLLASPRGAFATTRGPAASDTSSPSRAGRDAAARPIRESGVHLDPGWICRGRW